MAEKLSPGQRWVVAGAAGATLAASLAGAHRAFGWPRPNVSATVLRMALRATWREARATADDRRRQVLAVALRG